MNRLQTLELTLLKRTLSLESLKLYMSRPNLSVKYQYAAPLQHKIGL